MGKHKSEDYKITAVKYFLNENKTQLEVCDIFKCSPRSLLRWVVRYNAEGEIKRHNRFPIAYKMKTEQVAFLLEEIKKNKLITIKELMILLKAKFPEIELHQSHLRRIVRNSNISLKLKRVRHEPTKRFGKDIDINQKLKEFYKTIKKYDINDVICIDETNINALQGRNFCYSKVGKRCVVKTSSQEVFKRYTAIFAISSKGVVGWKLYDKGGINTDRLYEFLEENITNEYENKLIILDNASSHRNERIKELIEENNKLLYSIPYQHFTNAIEQYFSMLKSRLYKLNGLTYDELTKNIEKVLEEIPKEHYKNIIKGAYERQEKYVSNVKQRKPIVKNYL